jgi:hypothetical protein
MKDMSSSETFFPLDFVVLCIRICLIALKMEERKSR